MTAIKETIESLRAGSLIFIEGVNQALIIGANTAQSITSMLQHTAEHKASSPVVLVSNLNMLEGCVPHISEPAYQLLEVTESPIGLLFPNARNIPNTAVDSNGFTEFRFIQVGFLHTLIERMRQPMLCLYFEDYQVSTEQMDDSEILTIREELPEWSNQRIQFNADNTFNLLNRS